MASEFDLITNAEPSLQIPPAAAQTPRQTASVSQGAVEAGQISEALEMARSWRLSSKRRSPGNLVRKWTGISKSFRELKAPLQYPLDDEVSGETTVDWIRTNRKLLNTALNEVRDSLKRARKLPEIETSEAGRIKRAYAASAAYLRACGYLFSQVSFIRFFAAVQESCAYEMRELWALKSMMQLVLMEEIAHAAGFLPSKPGRRDPPPSPLEGPDDPSISRLIASLRGVGEVDWKAIFEGLNPADGVLREDPSGTYPEMDFESRDFYRKTIQELASSSTATEIQVAQAAIALSRATQFEWCSDPRVKERRRHVGYYIVDKGRNLLEKQIHYRPSLLKQVERTALEWPEVYYLVGIELLTFAIMTFALGGVFASVPLISGLLLLLLPAVDCAIAVINQIVSTILPPHVLPKFDFSMAIPAEFSTMVVIPTLLLDEEFVLRMTQELETRYLANRDPHLHFALLTDFPDSAHPSSDREDLVELCSGLIHKLNQKYSRKGEGPFFLFHREKIFNPSEGAWMGWERKRGKLLDLIFALRGERNNFAVMVGNRSVLSRVRFVITLDADTQLPRGAAQRLVATLAHPLNRPVIDPRTNTVAEGYGILQPRVGISIHAAGRSLLADILSTQTGFDPYTRATSDVYQDLFGEGSFTGKGIFEVEVFHQVLAERFPCNAILSHDLIEGNYARAGLVSDIEVIDDYPSHFSAYIRRKHRWVRGDWQIMRWLLPRVPDSQGVQVPNPLGMVSRWKIFDNLRRSVNEIALFLLLLAGWLVLPGSSLRWALAVLVLLLIPTYIQLAFSLLKLGRTQCLQGYLKEVGEGFIRGQVNSFFQLVFLPHQTLVMLDAIVRTIVRLTITQKKLLEWETAAEAEQQTKKTPVDIYLGWTPWLSLIVGASVALIRPSAFMIAFPFLVLWASSGPLVRWLNRPLQPGRTEIKSEDQEFLRNTALLTWRYFRHQAKLSPTGLVPDNIQETPPDVANRISPTNLGLLLNSQLAAVKLGFLTVEEFADEAQKTLATARRLARYQGHFLNWYDTESLQPQAPLFVSTVDSGNLACCLWTLKQGCLDLIKQPPLSGILWRGLRDHINILEELASMTSASSHLMRNLRALGAHVDLLGDNKDWPRALVGLEDEVLQITQMLPEGDPELEDLRWWASEALERIRRIRSLMVRLTPWRLEEFRNLLRQLSSEPTQSFETVPLDLLPAAIKEFSRDLLSLRNDGLPEPKRETAANQFQEALSKSISAAGECAAKLSSLAETASRLVEEMDFRFLFDVNRKVLSVGFNLTDRRLEKSCYDLLASEARSAVFVAIAKGEIPQESWFHLGRSHVKWEGRRALLSWSGTMFEYLMPTLWFRNYPRTILSQSALAAVKCQQKWGASRGIPWGASEAAYNRRDAAGHYQYRAFGLPPLALNPHSPDETVIAPYASFLALDVDSYAAVHNLRRMAALGWLGKFGFCDSADFTRSRIEKDYAIVRCWMAHHQGMSIVAACNLLTRGSMQDLFHREPAVAATDLLLHERLSPAVRVEPAEVDSCTVPLVWSGIDPKLAGSVLSVKTG